MTCLARLRRCVDDELGRPDVVRAEHHLVLSHSGWAITCTPGIRWRTSTTDSAVNRPWTEHVPRQSSIVASRNC